MGLAASCEGEHKGLDDKIEFFADNFAVFILHYRLDGAAYAEGRMFKALSHHFRFIALGKSVSGNKLL
jgi:hypothetical protein